MEGRIASEADLVSSALSLHPQCTSNCGFVLYIASIFMRPFFVYAETINTEYVFIDF